MEGKHGRRNGGVFPSARGLGDGLGRGRQAIWEASCWGDVRAGSKRRWWM